MDHDTGKICPDRMGAKCNKKSAHYVKSVQIQGFFWFVFSCIQFKYRYIRIRKNSVFGHFSRSGTM